MKNALKSSGWAVGAACTLTIVLSGCKAADVIPRDLSELASRVSGAAVSATTCYALIKGKHRAWGTAVCGAIGGWVGGELYKYLTKEEQVELAEATYETRKTGKKQVVRTKEGTTIVTEPVRTSAPSPERLTSPRNKKEELKLASSECGKVKQTIVTKNNERYEETIEACAAEDGTWVVT